MIDFHKTEKDFRSILIATQENLSKKLGVYFALINRRTTELNRQISIVQSEPLNYLEKNNIEIKWLGE